MTGIPLLRVAQTVVAAHQSRKAAPGMDTDTEPAVAPPVVLNASSAVAISWYVFTLTATVACGAVATVVTPGMAVLSSKVCVFDTARVRFPAVQRDC